LPYFNQIWIFSTDFHKSHNDKFHENLSSEEGVHTCYMKKLIGCIHDYANMPLETAFENETCNIYELQCVTEVNATLSSTDCSLPKLKVKPRSKVQ